MDRLFCANTLDATSRLACQFIESVAGAQIANPVAQLVLGYGETSRDSLAGERSQWIHHDDVLVAKAQQWLARNYSRKLKVDELAAAFSVSERTLFRRFQQALGMTPHHYLRALRIESVKRLLVYSDIGIEQLAIRFGYEDFASFRAAFRQQTGCNPSDYRRDRGRKSAPNPESLRPFAWSQFR